MKSGFLKLDWKDFLKGLLVTVITSIIVGIQQAIQAGTFPTTWAQWSVILIASFSAGLAYLLKNLLTNSEEKVFNKEPEK